MNHSKEIVITDLLVAFLARRDLFDGIDEDEGNGRSVPGYNGTTSSCYGSCIFQ